MGLIRTGPGARRPQYAPGAFLSRVVGPNVVASAWPTPRKRRRTLYARSIEERFREIVNTVKLLNPIETNAMRDALRRHNESHEGLRGTAAIRPEDLDQSRLAGRLWAFILPGGRISMHVDAIHDITCLLDWFEPQVGSMLVRTGKTWKATSPCQPGATMRLMPESMVPTCCPPAQLWPPNQAVP